MEVVVVLHSFLDAQLEDVGEVAGGIKAQIDHWVSDARGGYKEGEKGVKSRIPVVQIQLVLIPATIQISVIF